MATNRIHNAYQQTELNREAPDALARELVEQEREAVRRAVRLAVKIYGPAFKELAKY